MPMSSLGLPSLQSLLFTCSSCLPSNHHPSLNHSWQLPVYRISLSTHDPCRRFPSHSSWLGNRSIATNWAMYNGLFGHQRNRRRINVINSITDWRTGSRVKVIGFGARATSALQFCHESMLLSSGELWIPGGDTVNSQSFELLNKGNVTAAYGNSLDGAPIPTIERCCDTAGLVVLVLGIGAGTAGKVALDILQSSREQGGLSVMIVIQPFDFEGQRRKKEIEVLTANLMDYTDLSFVFQHDALFRRERVTLAEALKLANSAVLFAIRAVSDLYMGDQLKVLDAPPEGFREIDSSEVLSIFGHAGNAWVGFGSSYSVKSAVQRAAFESPFLKGLVPGVKGLVACTIASAEPKGRKDLQAALYALRCIIGPRAHLICTSAIEPTMRKGLILVTLLVTRIDNGSSYESPKQSIMFPELSFPFTLLAGNSDQSSSSLNGRELRKSRLGGPAEDLENLANGSMSNGDVQEDWDDSSNLFLNGGSLGNALQSNMHENALGGDALSKSAVSAGSNETLKGANIIDPEDVAVAWNSNGLESLFPADMDTYTLGITQETTLGKDSQLGVPTESVEKEDIRKNGVETLRQQESGSSYAQNQTAVIGRWGASSGKEKPVSGKGNDMSPKWKIPSLPSLLEWGKSTMIDQKRSYLGWECGPNSAAAEAWAKARQQLGNFVALDKNELYKFPIGVKPTDALESTSPTLGRQQVSRPRLGEPVNQSALFDPAVPISRVISSGLGAVADIYNAASAKVLKRDGNEEGKQVSSFLSQRAASMLETERSSKKLTRLVEMNYKNGFYKGRCHGGLPEGKGRLTYADGSFYDGLWKQGKRTGVGSFYYANGDVFQGCWRDDQMHGKGWLYFHTGDRLYSDFWKGKANGEGRYYSAKGDVFFGHFRENWRHGKCLSIEPSGIRWCEIWDDGVLVSRTQLEDTEQN